MNGKNIRRLIAAIMTLVCFFAYVAYEPAVSLAQTIGAEHELTENIDEMNSVWEQETDKYSPLLGEFSDEREEDIKRFRRADGATEVIVYSLPVHYMVDDEWVAIDNTLRYDEKTGRFVNAANDFTVEFAASSPAFSIGYRGETFSMIEVSMPGITDTELTAVVQERERQGELTDEEKDDLLRFPEELSSAISYYAPGGKEAALLYRLSGKSLSEYATLFEKPEETPVFTYTFETSLIPYQEGNAVLFRTADGEEIMYFSAPIMQDAEGNECSEFTVELVSNEDGSYTYTLVPNEDWLLNEERTYPVVIDPDISVTYSGTISDTFISGTNPSNNYQLNNNTKWDRIKIGSDQQYRSLIKFSNLPALKPGDVVVSSVLKLSRYDTHTTRSKEIDAYRVQRPWSEENVTWTSFYSDPDAVDTSRIESLMLTCAPYDVNHPSDEQFNELEITDLVKRWYAGTYTSWYTSQNLDEQYSILLMNYNDTTNHWYTEYRSAEYNNTYSQSPYFKIITVNSTGLESRFSYSSQNVGRAGTGNVNLYSGNLTFSFADAQINNGTMPISVSHVYNTNDKDTDWGYGAGWRLNYAQNINAVLLQNRTEKAIYYEYIDGDGTRHYYKRETDSKYVNELDKDSVLTIDSNSGILTITDKGDNRLIFTCGYFYLNSKKVFTGHLTKIKDANGNETRIEYTNDSFDGSAYKNIRIASITEKLAGNSSAGQSITFTYDSDRHLSGITVPNGLNRTYSYTNNDLTGFSATDGNSCTYSYNGHKLTSARNIDDYNINYSYDILNRVTSALEKAGTVSGNSLAFDYAWNVTTVSDNHNRKKIYQFNDAGQAVSIRDTEGNAVYAAYNTAEQTTTQLAAVSKMQHTVVNLLDNPGFDRYQSSSYSPWVKSSGTTFYGSNAHTGRNCMRLSTNNYVQQTVSVYQGKEYTLSGYFKGGAGVTLKVYDGSTCIAASDEIETNSSDWVRGVLTFTATSSSITIKAEKDASDSNYTYCDSFQLEAGNTPNRFNMLTNGDFSSGISGFTGSSDYSSNDGVVSNSDATHPSYLSSSVLKITGDRKDEYVSQEIYVTGHAGDTYSFGGWCASDSVPMSYQPDYSSYSYILCGERSIKVEFYNNSTKKGEAVAYFSADTADWQFASSSAVADSNYTKIVISVRFCNSRNTAYFDGLQLYREQFSQSYTYDSNGNLTGYHSLIGQEPTLVYDDDTNDLLSSTDPLDHTTTYTYDNHHNLLTTTTEEGVVTTNTYDTNGNVTSTKVGNSTNYIKTSAAYDSASALATAVTDARGNSVTYDYDSTTRQQTSITDPKGNESTYTYGNAAAMLRLASLTSDGTGTVGYTYDAYGKLTKIARGSTNYNFTYDDWGRVADIKVGNLVLSTNHYDAFGRLDYVLYGNDYKTEYEYDSLDRVYQISQGLAQSMTPADGVKLVYEFIYNGEGDLYELRNYKTHRATFFEYDHAGRCMASTEKAFTGDSSDEIEYGDPVSGYKYEYDLNNNLTKLTCELMGTSWSTIYTYDGDNRPTVTNLSSGKRFVNTYDDIGRITSVSLMYGDNNTILDTAITYLPGANGSQTALVSTYTNGNDDAYSYSYDANGNITSITKGSQSFTYEYDAANQLIRENLYYGSGNSNNATYTYSYDQWGNIYKKSSYAYTVSDLPATAQSEISYGYDNRIWCDLLTSYNGQTITYDAMGNPTSYRGQTLSWEGKQLTQVLRGSGTSGMSWTYTYDENGLRMRKDLSYNGVAFPSTEYYYNGSVLIGMTCSTTFQRFSYDASGRVVAVDYSTDSGSTYTTYYYLRNAQGDVVKLIDGSGNTVVEYTYDSWGKLLSVTGTLASTLGGDQPFRYRGYVYDNETGWYYLQSRYYDPTTCRFISADVYLSTGQGVLGHNAFAYCGNNPIIRSDKDGNDWLEDAWNWFCGKVEDAWQAITNTFGFTYVVETDCNTSVQTNPIAGCTAGYVESEYTGSGFDKPIVFFFRTNTEWWKIWEYQIGVNINIGDVSCNIAGGIPGLSKFSMEFNYQDTGVELSVSIDEISFSATETKGDTNHSLKGYTKYHIKTWALVGVAVIAYGVMHCPPLLVPVCGSLLMAY